MEGRKRKREPGVPRISYHVKQLGRSFERLFKEDSHEELCNVVRRKLALDKNTKIHLVQVREKELYDLEDDEDFEAFKAAAYESSSIDVRVSILGRQDRRKGQNKRVSVADQSTQDGSLVLSPSIEGGQDGPNRMPLAAEEETPTPSKRQMKGHDEGNDGTSSRKKRKIPKAKEAAPAEEDVDPEPPKKKQKTARAQVMDISLEEHAPATTTSAVPAVEAATPDHDHHAKRKEEEMGEKRKDNDKETEVEKEKGKKKRVKGKEKGEKKEKDKRKKKRKGEIFKNDHVSGMLSQETPISVHPASTSTPQPLVLHEKSSKSESTSRDAQPPSPPSDSSTSAQVQSVVAAFLRRPARTSAEILASYSHDMDDGSEGDEGREREGPVEEPVKPTNVKKKKKEKGGKKAGGKQTDTAANGDRTELEKSLLRESRVPEDVRDAPSPPPPVQPSSSRLFPPSSTDLSPVVALSTSPLSRPHPPNTPFAAKSSSNAKLAQLRTLCPICPSRAFHPRFQCPVMQSGLISVRTRIMELKRKGGQDNLIDELEEWVSRAESKEGEKEKAMLAADHNREANSPTSHRSPDLKSVFSCTSERHVSPSPSRTPILPLQSQPSKVTIECRDEGSSEESASSGFSSEDQGLRSAYMSKSDAESKSDSWSNSDSRPNSDSGSDAESHTDHAAGFFSVADVNLDEVDLNALVRGPVSGSSFVDLMKLLDGSSDEGRDRAKNDEDEDDVGVLEEEVEGKVERPKRLAARRSSTPCVVNNDDDDDDSDSEDGPGAEEIAEVSPFAMHRLRGIDLPVNEMSRYGRADEQGDVESQRDEEHLPRIESEVRVGLVSHQSPPPEVLPEPTQPQVGGKEMVMDVIDPMTVDPATSVCFQTSMEDERRELPNPTSSCQPDLQSAPSTPRATISSAPITLRLRAPPNALGIVHSMKDQHGVLPLNPPDDNIGTGLAPIPVPLDLPDVIAPIPQMEQAAAVVTEKPKRGRSRAPSQRQSSVTQRKLRSRTASPSTATSEVSSSAPQRKRGRPPLSEAVKAERQAIKDAEKAAKAAAKRAKAEEKKAVTACHNEKDRTRTEPMSSLQEISLISQNVSPAPPAACSPTVVTPPASHWTTLPPGTASSPVESSSPPLDQLMSSSQSIGNATLYRTRKAPKASTFDSLERVESPGDISMTSTSRKNDEDDVEDIVGSFNAVRKLPSPKGQPLFLPGASQMTQSHTVHVSLAQSPDTEEVTKEPAVDDEEQSASDSTHTEPQEMPRKPTIPRPRSPPQSTFPSLSQLSFEKFRPSFLLSKTVFSQNEKTVASQQLDESESDDDDSDDAESSDDEKQSHIPKGRRAGVGVTQKRKSRGLLH